VFSDLTILDLSTVLAGPSVGTFFAELGARVIKIEHPENPDVTRSWKLPEEDSESNVSAYFASVNYQKEYINLNLKMEADRQQLLDLVKTADILLSNFKKGDEAKFNITDALLRSLNPKLICGKINGFGSQSDRVAYDLILQAESGFMSMNGTPESGPVKMPVALIDVLAAHHLKEGLLVALLQREKDGIGRTVSVSLYDAAICSLMNQASNYLMTGKVAERTGSLHPNIAPYGELFQTKDGATITFAIGSDVHFTKLCKHLNAIELSTDERFSNNTRRVSHRKELYKLLQDKIQFVDSDILLEILERDFVPAGKVKSLDEVFTDQQAAELIRTENNERKETKRITSIAFKWE
jgi:crotonobetainyl-CoA:carnitine CoA-transferase CaiB-like acyl-CoA transferase